MAFTPSAQQLRDVKSVKQAAGQGNYTLGANVGYRNVPRSNVLGAYTESSSSSGYSPQPAQTNQQNNNLSLQGVLQEQPQAPQIDYDAMIRPALEGLDAAMGSSQSAYEANLGDIETSGRKSIQGQQSALDEAKIAAAKYKTSNQADAENQVNEQRRGFSEISQGIQSRYGGSTGTGAFATQVAGAQSLKNIGAVRQGLSQAITSIDDRLEQVKGATQIAIQDLEDQMQNQKLRAKADLDQALSQIRIAKGELQSRKAELATQAIQMYQQQVQQVNAANAQFKQQLYTQSQAAEQQLAAARARAGEAAKQFSITKIGVDPNTGYDQYGTFESNSGTVSPLNFTGGGQLTQTSQEDDLYGLAN